MGLKHIIIVLKACSFSDLTALSVVVIIFHNSQARALPLSSSHTSNEPPDAAADPSSVPSSKSPAPAIPPPLLPTPVVSQLRCTTQRADRQEENIRTFIYSLYIFENMKGSFASTYLVWGVDYT